MSEKAFRKPKRFSSIDFKFAALAIDGDLRRSSSMSSIKLSDKFTIESSFSFFSFVLSMTSTKKDVCQSLNVVDAIKLVDESTKQRLKALQARHEKLAI